MDIFVQLAALRQLPVQLEPSTLMLGHTIFPIVQCALQITSTIRRVRIRVIRVGELLIPRMIEPFVSAKAEIVCSKPPIVPAVVCQDMSYLTAMENQQTKVTMTGFWIVSFDR